MAWLSGREVALAGSWVRTPEAPLSRLSCECWCPAISKLGSKSGRRRTDHSTTSSRDLVSMFLYGDVPNDHLDMGPTLTLALNLAEPSPTQPDLIQVS